MSLEGRRKADRSINRTIAAAVVSVMAKSAFPRYLVENPVAERGPAERGPAERGPTDEEDAR